jgi:hypothetical protein
MKYVDSEALARLFGKVLPFSVEYFAKHIEKILVNINDGMVRSEFAGAADVLLANNRANKQGTWERDIPLSFLLLLTRSLKAIPGKAFSR